ncbi:MAG TPA: branched-chain amino acid ABC transporter permease [Actinomycetota bacterium]|nr:branched-chain amino acid ABC transporter permease [Actinomycetota bacterium]
MIFTSILNGLITGTIYGLVALGLVLVYKGARVFNFAQGEFGTVAVFVAWILHTEPPGLPMLVALLLGLAAATLMGLLVERVVVRPLSQKPRVILLVATAGVAVGSIYLQLLLGEAEARVLPRLGGDRVFFVLNAALIWQNIIMILALVVIGVALYLFFSRTALGLAVLASSQDNLASQLSGVSTRRVSSLVWGLAAFLGGMAGLLQAPLSVFTPGFMTTTVLFPAFTGAVLGGMTSLPGAFVGGLGVGVLSQLGADYIPETIPGGRELVLFALLLLVLSVRPQGLLGKEA